MIVHQRQLHVLARSKLEFHLRRLFKNKCIRIGGNLAFFFEREYEAVVRAREVGKNISHTQRDFRRYTKMKKIDADHGVKNGGENCIVAAQFFRGRRREWFGEHHKRKEKD